jgi:hypothetical protein
MLAQERKTVRQILAWRASQSVNAESQGEEAQRNKVFTTWEQWKAVLDRFKKKEINVSKLKEYIDATKDYYLYGESIRISKFVLEDEWRRAKVVEMLHRITQYLPGMKIAEECSKRIYEYTGSDDSLRKFEYMRLLLLSQSGVWIDGRYSLLAGRDPAIVREAIKQLCDMKEDPEEGREISLATDLLCAINQQGYGNFFPTDYRG